MTKIKLSTFKIDFEIFLISKQIKKTELSNQLKMSLPTLLKRISDPERFNLKEINKLKRLGFDVVSYFN